MQSGPGDMIDAAGAATRGWRLLVVLPALNEAATIADVIARVPRQLPGVDSVEILVVDDGSTDETAELARRSGADVISHHVNRGVGAAIQSGLAEAIRRRVDIAVNIDSDGQFDPATIRDLIAPVLEGRADMTTASRFKDRSLVPAMPLAKRLGNWGMARLVSVLSGGDYADVSCGFRAYSQEALLRLVLTGSFTYTQESFLVLAAKGLKIIEVPIAVRGVREHGTSRVASSLPRYAVRTTGIIFGSVRDHRPSAVFGTVAAALLLCSCALGTFFVWHRLATGQFSPHIWAGFVSAFLFGLAMLTFGLGQVAVMISRLRLVQEQQFYLLRRLDGLLHESRPPTPPLAARRQAAGVAPARDR